VLEMQKSETASYTPRNFIRRREVKTIMLVLVLMAGAAWGQRAQTCKACPSAADMVRQLDPKPPKHPRPEKAKEQRPAKRAPRAKNRSDAGIPRHKEATGGEHAQDAPSAAKQP